MKTLEILQNQIKQKTLPQSIILESSRQSTLVEGAQELVRLLNCPNISLINDQCAECQRQKSWLDTHWIGDGSTEISKDPLQQIMNDLLLSALENNGHKIYIIQNAENLKVMAANALLKFLEEPPANTYAVLLTKDKGRILPTIKSRCQTYRLAQIESPALNRFGEYLKAKKGSELLLGSFDFKDVPLEELITMIHDSLINTIWPLYPFWAEPTMQLITDLKGQANNKLALDNYFIILSRGPYENS